MKRLTSAFASVAVLMVLSSATPDNMTGTTIGQFAPELSIANDQKTLTLTQQRGRYTLLSFWKASDASSRQQNKFYSVEAAKTGIEHFGINLDEDSTLFHALVDSDGLNAATQFNVQGKDATIIAKKYRLSDIVGTILIDPNGRIVAINPGRKQLASL